MAALVERHPSLLETIGPAVLNIAAFRRGCAPALEFLLDRGLVFSVAEESEYDIVHEAAWAVSTDNLRILLERGMADAKQHLEPAHRLARQRLPPLLAGRPPQRGRTGRRAPHPAAVGARRRP